MKMFFFILFSIVSNGFLYSQSFGVKQIDKMELKGNVKSIEIATIYVGNDGERKLDTKQIIYFSENRNIQKSELFSYKKDSVVGYYLTNYDSNGNAINSSFYRKKVLEKYTESNYDEFGNKTKLFTKEGMRNSVNDYKNKYDDKNRLIEIEGFNKGKSFKKTFYEYDATNNITKEVSESSYLKTETSYDYNNSNQVTEYKHNRDNKFSDHRKNYYKLGKIIRFEDFNALGEKAGEHFFEYDNSGNLIGEKDGYDQVTYSGFDKNKNWILQKRNSSGTIILKERKIEYY